MSSEIGTAATDLSFKRSTSKTASRAGRTRPARRHDRRILQLGLGEGRLDGRLFVVLDVWRGVRLKEHWRIHSEIVGPYRVSGFVEQQLRAEEWLCAIGSSETSNHMLYE
jgi:hypothetical protein